MLLRPIKINGLYLGTSDNFLNKLIFFLSITYQMIFIFLISFMNDLYDIKF
jgi:hypothetical protein